MRTQLDTVSKYYDIDLNMKIKDLPKEKLDIILYGSPDIMEFKYISKNGNTRNAKDYYEGVITNLERRYIETKSTWIRDWIEGYMTESVCQTCNGSRLNSSMLSVLINNKNIYITNQTTLSKYELQDIYDKLKNKYPNSIIDNKICDATTLRQQAIMNIKNCDLCIVVGDKSSSNSNKLVDVAKSNGLEAILVDNYSELKKIDLNSINSIAVTSGASTPSYVVDDVIKNVDDAVRIMIYRNDESVVYGKINANTNEPETGTVAFRNDEDGTIILEKRSDMVPDQVDKITIVIWLEGDDPECVNAILGGEMKIHMDITEEHVDEENV
jgi:(E)-4-hydroxy-3-methyl-but-2-enyl pyrophosphate reductase